MEHNMMLGQQQMPCAPIQHNNSHMQSYPQGSHAQITPQMEAYSPCSHAQITPHTQVHPQGSPGQGPSARGYYPMSNLYEQQLFDRYCHQQIQRYQQQLERDWVEHMAKSRSTIADAVGFKSHPIPLARIKRIMRADEDVRMIAAETPVLFAKACEAFILDLTQRSWKCAAERGSKTVNRSDIVKVVHQTRCYDFLDDIMPLDDASGIKSELERIEKPANVGDSNTLTSDAHAFGSPVAEAYPPNSEDCHQRELSMQQAFEFRVGQDISTTASDRPDEPSNAVCYIHQYSLLRSAQHNERRVWPDSWQPMLGRKS